MACRTVDSSLFAVVELDVVRNASGGGTSGYLAEVGSAGTGSRICGSHFKRASFGLLVAVVLAYQILGTLGEWAIVGDFALAVQDFRIGLPGMALQIVGGWLFINRLIRR